MQAAQTPLDRLLGHYRILWEIGRGGMSVVYEAIDSRFGRHVAIKVLSVPPNLSPELRDAMIARLKREARAVARLSHPNVVAIFDIGEDSGQHFLVMEHLDGVTLRERLADGPLAPAAMLPILEQVAAGLDSVHAAGIVHRDIKPSNVMLLPGGTVKLMDFGVARQTEDTLVTQAGMIVGSPAYMAPEQIQGDDSRAASDLWALGVILYEMLTGRPPFTGGNIPQTMYKITHDAAPMPPAVTPAVRRFLGRALDKNPDRRFRSARALVDAFRAALPPPSPAPAVAASATEATQVIGKPPPVAPRPPARRSLSRPRALLPLVLVAVLLLAAGLTFLIRGRHRLPPVIPAHRTAAVRPAKPTVRVASSRQVHQGRPVGVASRPVAVASRSVVTPAPLLPHHPIRRHRPTKAPHVARAARPARVSSVRPPRRPYHARPPVLAATASRAPSRPPVRLQHRRIAAAPLKVHARPRRKRLPPPAIAAPVTAPPAASAQTGGGGPNMLGTWHGSHSHHPATLVVTGRRGDTFTGVMSVRTPDAHVHIAVTGRVSPRTGAVSMRETRVLSATAPRAWDLGSESGHVSGKGKITGTGTDIKGRSGSWNFSR